MRYFLLYLFSGGNMKKRINRIWSNLLIVDFALAVKMITYSSAIIIGIIGAYYYLSNGFSKTGHLIAGIYKFYEAVGPAFWGLMPMTLYLIYLCTNDILVKLGYASTLARPKHYDRIRENAPLCGILGTMLGLAAAVNSMDVSIGMQKAIVALSVKVGSAVISSAFGIILVLFINILVPLINDRWDAVLDIEKSQEKLIPLWKKYLKQAADLSESVQIICCNVQRLFAEEKSNSKLTIAETKKINKDLAELEKKQRKIVSL